MTRKFTITIQCENAAFEDDPLGEISRILAIEAKRLALWAGDNPRPRWSDTLLDVNGNVVGSACLTGNLS
jgi:hypothetical protein